MRLEGDVGREENDRALSGDELWCRTARTASGDRGQRKYLQGTGSSSSTCPA